MLLDSSAWVEYLRATGSSTHLAVRSLLRSEAHIATCDPVVMEILAGGRSESHTAELQRLLGRATLLSTRATDWLDAARIYRTGRRQGVTIRKLADCLIAAVAIRSGEPVLHHDADFDAIALISPLQARRAI